MHELARGLFSRRDNEHRIDRFDDSDRRIVRGEKIYGHNNDHISSFVIQEFMILANRETAKFMNEEGVNGIYRTHMPEYSDGRELPKSLERAHYSAEMGFHTGLWIPEYMHSTSPIRRLADYISQRQLICLLAGEGEIYSPDQVKQICNYINLQIIAITGHQKDELLDAHGKRLIRRSKKLGHIKSVVDHIKHRQENGLKIPNSIRQAIIKKLQDAEQPLDEWIIRRFIGNGEKEILEVLCKRIKAENKVYKYLRILQSSGMVEFFEQEFESNGGQTITFTIEIKVAGKTIKKIEKSGEKIKGVKKALARGRGLFLLRKDFESMRRHDSHSLKSRLKSEGRREARDYYLDYLVK